ncbi:MAG: heavy metal-associated domain-containing protein [Candidatus Micrarchaeota archaeon]
MIHNLKISGMHCASCEKMVKMSVEEIDGAKLISISSKTGEAKVELKDGSLLSKVKAAINGAGYQVRN